MPNIPPSNKDAAQITWFENHLPGWSASPTTYGLTEAQVTTLESAVTAARNSYNAARDARQASKNATVSQDTGVRSMLNLGRDVVNVMKAFIENSGNASLWGAAGLEPPAPPGPSPVPTAPYLLASSLDAQGNVILTWKATQPRGATGTVYAVSRSFDGGPYTLLDTVGGKKFTDESVPDTVATVSYTLQAKRGELSSPFSEALTIRLGKAPPGTASGAQVFTAKLAA